MSLAVTGSAATAFLNCCTPSAAFLNTGSAIILVPTCTSAVALPIASLATRATGRTPGAPVTMSVSRTAIVPSLGIPVFFSVSVATQDIPSVRLPKVRLTPELTYSSSNPKNLASGSIVLAGAPNGDTTLLASSLALPQSTFILPVVAI